LPVRASTTDRSPLPPSA